MELALSITGTLATLISVAIALVGFSAEARLHRRITKLRSIDEIMSGSPSPVINRALRLALADLQARELLRFQLHDSRMTSSLFAAVTIITTLVHTVLSFGPLFVPSVDRDWPSTLVWSALWPSVLILNCMLQTRHAVFERRREDYAAALFSGVAPSQEQLFRGASKVLNYRWWKRSLVTAILYTVALSSVGVALGQLTFSLLAPEFVDQYAAIGGLFIAIAVGFAAFGNASSMSSRRRNVWPQPCPRDFIAHD